MLTAILLNTPRWVFVLFLVLLVMGYWQSKDRIVSRHSVGILPAVFLILAISGEELPHQVMAVCIFRISSARYEHFISLRTTHQELWDDADIAL